MSVQASTWATSQTVGSHVAKHVLITVANYAHVDGTSSPSLRRLMRETELSEQAVRKALRHLEAKGFLARSPQPVGGSDADLFHFHLRIGEG